MRMAILLLALVISTPVAAQPQPSTASMLRQARTLNAEGKQADAIALYDRILAAAPTLFDAHYGRGIALDLAGRFDEAHQAFARARQLASDDEKTQAQVGAAISYVFAGDPAQAEAIYRQVYEAQTAANSYGAAGETANALGRIYLETGDPAEALRWYRTGHEAALKQSGEPGAVRDLFDMRWAHAQARIAARRGDAATARAEMAAARAILDKGTNPDEDIQYPYLAGYVALALKQYAEAAEALQRADQKDPFVLMLLAESYEGLGDAARARETYAKVLASNAHSLNNAFARPVAKKKLSVGAPGDPLPQQ
jgi:tetratricopeptide (TPR) repeat protein